MSDRTNALHGPLSEWTRKAILRQCTCKISCYFKTSPFFIDQRTRSSYRNLSLSAATLGLLLRSPIASSGCRRLVFFYHLSLKARRLLIKKRRPMGRVLRNGGLFLTPPLSFFPEPTSRASIHWKTFPLSRVHAANTRGGTTRDYDVPLTRNRESDGEPACLLTPKSSLPAHLPQQGSHCSEQSLHLPG